MRPPHWLGRVIGKRRELNNIALAIAKSPRFRQAIQKGIDAGSQLETVLITGASSGIGLELAKLFATDNSNLVLVARSRKKLDQLAAIPGGELFWTLASPPRAIGAVSRRTCWQNVRVGKAANLQIGASGRTQASVWRRTTAARSESPRSSL